MNLKQRLLKDFENGRIAFKRLNEICITPPFTARTKQAKKTLSSALKELEANFSIVKDRRGRYCTPAALGVIKGKIQAHEKGYAFLKCEDGDKDYFIPAHSLNGALEKDIVLAAAIKGTDDEAYVLKIIERGVKSVVGVFDGRTVYPDDLRYPEVYVSPSLSGGAKNGEKVLCEITAYRTGKKPAGKVSEILGESGDFEAEELSIIRSYGLYEEFDAESLDEAERVALEKISADGRLDLRDELIFTVDGEDTKDIDDAISLEIKDGKFYLGVHIADVSHYVKPRSAMDKQAFSRGTSVYFPDRVLPMLPKRLSNGVCSLNENEDRYALSCLMTFDESGERCEYAIKESVINSKHRLTYKEINAMCAGDKEISKKYRDIAGTVANMQRLCLIMEKRRKAAGEVSLDLREAKIYVDGDGNICIPDYERGIGERIIEQFMIAANEAVANFLESRRLPCLYRIHEKPAEEKIENLTTFLNGLGVKVNFDRENPRPADFQKILNEAKDKPYSAVISKVMLRCMQKARYCEKNLGHFGLASDSYCHFTSPIRRYPDLFVHRTLRKAIEGGANFSAIEKFAPVAAKECSEKERCADEAERDVDALYTAVYMSDRIGEIFEATVSGVTNFGVFCELDNTVEGIIPLEVLPKDRYEYFPERFALTGAKYSFRLGDRVKVKVDGCDWGRMRTLFSPVS